MISRCPIRKVRVGQPRKGLVIDDAYRAFIRSQPCICCGSRRYVECAHVGIRGMGQKCSDYDTLPLCSAHHVQGPESHHVLGRRFWTVWGLDRTSLIEKYQQEYLAAGGRLSANTERSYTNGSDSIRTQCAS